MTATEPNSSTGASDAVVASSAEYRGPETACRRLRSGWIAPRFVIDASQLGPEGMAGNVATDLQAAIRAGLFRPNWRISSSSWCLIASTAPRPRDLIDLVWTGPDLPGIVNRDTRVVVREMFRSARQSVLLAGYAVYQGQVVFKALAERMDQNPAASGSRCSWISSGHGMIPPPRLNWSDDSRKTSRGTSGLASDAPTSSTIPARWRETSELRASLHAKCIVVDEEQALVTSANFTTAAQQKNIEVGVLIRSSSFAARLSSHFRSLAAAGLLVPIPMG